jgi:hypothetical protein
VTNTLDVALKDAVLVYGKQAYLLGDMGPGESARVVPNSSTSLAGYLEKLSGSFALNRSGGRAGATIDRAIPLDAIGRVAMFHAGLGPRGLAWPADRLRELDLSGLAVDLRRPILVGAVERPGSLIRMDWSGKPPSTVQTTLLRFVLEAPKDEGAGAQ